MAKKIFLALFFTSVMAFSSITVIAKDSIHENIEQLDVEMPKQERIELARGKLDTKEVRETEEYRDGLAAYIQSVNDNVTNAEAVEIVDSIMNSADKYNVDEKLVMAIAHTESTYYRNAVSHADYKGLMQTGDVLAEEAGYTPQQLFDPKVSIDVGTNYIDEQLDEFGDTRLALTAYNQGPGTVYSGEYSTDYADLAMARMAAVEEFLKEKGYINVYN